MVEPTFVLLLFNLGVAASLASILSRFPAFARMLLREERSVTQRLEMALAFGLIFGAGAAARVGTGTYQAADLTLAGAFLAGLLGGYVTGMVSGILMSLPAMYVAQELLAMPLYAGVGVLGGLIRDCAPTSEEIWRYSPLFDLLSSWKMVGKWATSLPHAYRLLITVGVLFSEGLRFTGVFLFGERAVFSPVGAEDQPMPLWIALQCTTTVFCTLLPIKIWNTTRLEAKLSSQQRLLAEARLAALTSQINPHFLFNTLNSVSSLIRMDPERARAMIYKLSNVLRKAMRNTDNFTPLRDELAFIDDYLSIEMVRFGEKLRFSREIDPATLDCMVPAMILQPLVENSIRHGLAGKIEGGAISIKSTLDGNGRLLLVVEDDGVGIPEEKMEDLFGNSTGIGIQNVRQRLEVSFATDYRLSIDSRSSVGTRIEIDMPTARVALEVA